MATLPPLAVPDDVAALIGRTLTTAEGVTATRLIDLGSAIVRKETRQRIDAVANDTITLQGSWDQVLVLPQRPVTAITSVTVNGRLYSSSQYAWNRDGVLAISSGSFMPDFGASGLQGRESMLSGPAGSFASGPNPTALSWQGPNAQVVVVYSHGFADIPLDIVSKVAGMVAVQIQTSPGIMREDIGGYRVFYNKGGVGGGLYLTEEDRKDLRSYRKTSFSAPMKRSV